MTVIDLQDIDSVKAKFQFFWHMFDKIIICFGLGTPIVGLGTPTVHLGTPKVHIMVPPISQIKSNSIMLCDFIQKIYRRCICTPLRAII